MYRLLTSLLLLCSYSLWAQQPHIAGTVKDHTSTPVVSATVSLLKASDSSWVQTELTGDKGEFLFGKLNNDPYLLSITAIGHQTLLQPVASGNDIMITLLPAGTQLKEVVVKSSLPAIRTGPGKTTLNFEHTETPAGSDVLELLRKAPGVTVDASGNISMGGKAVLVMINDKPTYLSGEDLANYLRSLPADQVAKLDLMSQPSSRYDAEGNNGIINIALRKAKKGTNGNIALNYGQGVYPSTRNHGNFNYSKNNTNLYVNAGYLRGTGFLDQQVAQTAKDRTTGNLLSRTAENNYLWEVFEDYNLKLAADQRLTSRTKIGGSIQGIHHPNSETDRSRVYVDDLVNGTSVFSHALIKRGFIRQNMNSNLFLNYKPGDKRELNIDLDCLMRTQHDGQHMATKNYDAGMNELPGALSIRSHFPFYINVYIAKADYSAKPANGFELETGIKGSLMNNESGAFYEVFENNVWKYDSTRSNNYLYRENINAAYVNASGTIGNKWQAQAGLRVENTNIEGLQEVGQQHFGRSFTSVFPTAFVSYKANEAHTLELNCGRRINRPSYRDLNPFILYLSQFSSSSGNPELLPAFRNSVALKHNFRNMLFSEFSYAKLFNTYNSVLLYNAVTNAVHKTMHNNAHRHTLHFSSICNKQLAKWWEIRTSYDWYYNEYEDFNGNSLAMSHGHSVSINNQFSFNGWTIDTLYVFNSGDLQGLTERNGPNHWMNASVAKKILKDSGSIKLYVQDPFNVYRYTPTRNWEGLETTSVLQYATQQVYLGFTYNFGKEGGNRQRSSNSDEAKRM